MPDIFQFYSGSADAAPGKGAGETLESPPETYKELRAIKDWRRILAAAVAVDAPTPELARVLSLTRSAELWNKKERAVRLEEMRAAVQRNAPATPEMAENAAAAAAGGPAPAAPKPKAAAKPRAKKGAAAGAAAPLEAPPLPAGDGGPVGGPAFPVGAVPEGALADEAVLAPPAPPAAPPVGLDEPDRRESSIKFCPVCRYYLYSTVTLDPADTSKQELVRLCRNCGFREKDEKGGLVMEMMIQESASEGYKILLNEFTRRDPRLPHLRKNIKCPDPACPSNHGRAETDIIYIKYDPVNLLYLYICNVDGCGFRWRSRR